MENDPQQAWHDYHQRKRAERLAEAPQVWDALAAAGVREDTVLAIDFVHFGPSREAVEGLAKALAEQCTVSLEAADGGYWLLKGTTRPYGLTLTAEEHLAWVDYLCDLAASHRCVFSTWTLEAPSLAVTVGSESFQG